MPFWNDNDAEMAVADPPAEPTSSGVWTMGEAYKEGLLSYRPANPDEPMQAEFLTAQQLKVHAVRLGYVAVDHG